MSTLTSANSIFTLGCIPLYPVAVRIQDFAADDMFTSEEVEMGETVMGADGHLSAGYTPYKVPLEFTLMPTSASNIIMDLIADYQDAQQELMEFNASIMISSIGMTYVFSKGYFPKGSAMPAAKKIMQPRKFRLEFNKIYRTPI